MADPLKVSDNGLMPRNARYFWGGVLFFLAVLLFAGGFTVPFTFESPSILYKFGADKLLLRTGKLLGIGAALLLFFQLPLAGRLKFLDRIFFLPRLYRVHRLDAWIISIAVLLHPVCILIPDDRIMIPLEARYWPEWVGAGLLALILFQVIFAAGRDRFSIPYPRWRRVHQGIGVAAAAALGVHVLFVSETFDVAGIPRIALFILAGAWGSLWLWVRAQSTKRLRRRWRVAGVAAAGTDAYAVDLAPAGSGPFFYAPGQFAFFSFFSPSLSKEAHPFTLTSSPTRPDHLQITVRCCGDWTAGISGVRKGDAVFIQGPYGGFTHLFEPPDREVVMIAGGIGVTPMWSMLRYMSDVKDSRRVLLMWSNRSQAYLFGREELAAMEAHLTHFTWIPIFTREKAGSGRSGRLDLVVLDDLLKNIRRDAAVFICGPPEMIRRVRTLLRQLGFPRSSMRWESFGF